MKIKTSASLALVFSTSISFAQRGKMYQVKSPDGHINLSVALGNAISWSIKHDSTEVTMPSSISITLANEETLGKNAQFKPLEQQVKSPQRQKIPTLFL